MLHAILFLQLCVTPAKAHRAEELVHNSISEYDLGEFEHALHDAIEAYRLDPLPQILFNIAQAHRALEHWKEAAFFYHRYLSKLPDAPNRQKVEQLLADLQPRLEAEPRPGSPASEATVAERPAQTATPVVDRVPLVALEPSAKEPVEPHRGHTAAWVLGSVAVVSLAVAVIGIVEVENFESVVGQISHPTSWTSLNNAQSTAPGELPGAQVWETVAFATGAVALGTGTAAVLTW